MRYIKNLAKYKLWKKRNDIKKFKRRLKHKKNKHRKNSKSITSCNRKQFSILYKKFDVPKNFSILENANEIIGFFNIMLNSIDEFRKKYTRKKLNNIPYKIEINMENIDNLTIETLMYLITIIRSTRGNNFLPLNWVGNFPKNKEVSDFLKKSGFLKYMNTNKVNVLDTNECIQMKWGQGYNYEINKDIRQEVVDFTCLKLNKNKTEINFLMTMLTEMVTNISDHAYDNNIFFDHIWYIFVEDKKDKICYTFLDNGLGIPKTIKKTILESILINHEYEYIESGVKGDKLRSKTGKIYRGNGLPTIYEQSINNMNDLVIISNKAYFSKDKKMDLKNELQGTIYYWEIKKGWNNED